MKNKFNQFRAFLFLYWAMILSVTGMYTMYISDMGFSKKEISIAVTIYTLSGLIGQIIIGYIVDKLRQIKNVMAISLVIGLISAAGLLFIKENWQIYLMLTLWGFFISATYTLTDTWCINTLKATNEQRNFGKIRGFGSIGYGFSGVLLGLLLQSFGWKIYYWYIVLGIILTLIIMYFINDNSNLDYENSGSSISIKEGLEEIFKIKPLIVMIVIIFMYNFVVKGIYCYLAILVSDYGGGVASLGLTYCFDASPEIVTFFLTARLLKKHKSKSIILIAFLLQIIRLSVILVFGNSLAVILMGILSGFAYGLVAASYKTYIYELAPEKYKTSCMSISETIIGLSGIASAPIFGFMFTKFGSNSTILFGLIIDIILTFVMLTNNILSRKRKTS
ncbi:MAG: MFS transporter [Clostridiaceae bacterium]